MSARKIVEQKRPNLDSVEVYAWHGTTGVSANQIVKEGFDGNRIGKKFGKRYGNGFYFGKYASTSHPFSVLCEMQRHIPKGLAKLKEELRLNPTEAVFTMMLCKLVIGRPILGTGHMLQLPAGYDSARNGARCYYVIFNPDYILPLAIIEYTIPVSYANTKDDDFVFGSRTSLQEAAGAINEGTKCVIS